MTKYKSSKGVIDIAVVFIVVVALVFAGGYFYSKRGNLRGVNKKVAEVNNKIMPIPSPEASPIPTDWTTGDNSESIANIFHKSDIELLGYDIPPVECLSLQTGINHPNFWEWADSQGITDQIKMIESYEFSDEFVQHNLDGTTELKNAGERSKKKIFYETICRNEDSYSLLFTTDDIEDISLIPQAQAAGGVSLPYNLAHFDKDNFYIIENLPGDSKKISVETYDNFGMPYYGCRNIFGFYKDVLVMGCGGGDGGVGGIEIHEVNLETKSTEQKAFCWRRSEEVHCYDENANEYYTK